MLLLTALDTAATTTPFTICISLIKGCKRWFTTAHLCRHEDSFTEARKEPRKPKVYTSSIDAKATSALPPGICDSSLVRPHKCHYYCDNEAIMHSTWTCISSQQLVLMNNTNNDNPQYQIESGQKSQIVRSICPILVVALKCIHEYANHMLHTTTPMKWYLFCELIAAKKDCW